MTPITEARSALLNTVVDAISEAYYSERVRSGNSARTRAQTAQSTITLFAGGLIAALTFAALASHPLLTRAASVAAVSAWLLAAVLYVWAIASPVRQLVKIREATDIDDFVEKVLQKADIETYEVDKRQAWATKAAVAALVLSVLTFALAVILGPEEKATPGVVVLDQKSPASIVGTCQLSPQNVISGTIKETTLNAPFVAISVKRGTCASGVTVLRIPRSSVRAIGFRGK
ncbi:hypothetical protein ACSNOI_08410 [Actinomadura kijaniata]|uniref:hypothetical protein n=1 Tax=Actinomadura kijaniata TaxID=46161 RepID=UPI003F1D6D3E